MSSGKTWHFVRRAYQVTNTAIWALAVAMLLWFLVSFPNMQSSQREAERLAILELLGESRAHCEKWGLKPGTVKYADCLDDVQTIRENYRKRIMDEVF